MRREQCLGGRRWRRYTRILLLSFFISVLQGPIALHGLILSAHANEDDEDEAANRVQAPSRVRIVNGRTELVLSVAAERNAGIATAHPTAAPEQAMTEVYGEVLDPSMLTTVASRYRNTASQVTSAQARARASRAAFARVQSLYRDRQNMSAAQLQAAQSAYEIDEASLAAAQSSLSALDASVAQSWGPVLARAITHESSLLKDLIAGRDYLLTITLPPGVAPEKPPSVASAQLPGGVSIALKLVSPATTANPQVQGLRYYYEAQAARGLLAGLNVRVTLETPGQARGELIVPESAVVWLEGRPWIYQLVAAAPSSTSSTSAHSAEASSRRRASVIFLRESIAPERQTADRGYVVAGLAPGTEIVVRGAQLLLSEEFRAQVESQDED